MAWFFFCFFFGVSAGTRRTLGRWEATTSTGPSFSMSILLLEKWDSLLCLNSCVFSETSLVLVLISFLLCCRCWSVSLVTWPVMMAPFPSESREINMSTTTTGGWEGYATSPTRKLLTLGYVFLRHIRAADVSVLISVFQFCAMLGSCLPVFAYLIVLELSQSHTAALITATLLIFGEWTCNGWSIYFSVKPFNASEVLAACILPVLTRRMNFCLIPPSWQTPARSQFPSTSC